MTLGEMLDIEPDQKVDLAAIIKIVVAMTSKKLQRPEIDFRPVRAVKLLDLPCKPPMGATPKTVMHMVDIHKNIDVEWDQDDIGAYLIQKEIMKLPEQLRPARPTVHAYSFNFNIIPHEGTNCLAGKVDIIKHFIFDAPIPYEDAKALCSGQEMLIDFGWAKKEKRLVQNRSCI